MDLFLYFYQFIMLFYWFGTLQIKLGYICPSYTSLVKSILFFFYKNIFLNV